MLDMRDNETSGHSIRVAEMTMQFAQKPECRHARCRTFAEGLCCMISGKWAFQMQYCKNRGRSRKKNGK